MRVRIYEVTPSAEGGTRGAMLQESTLLQACGDDLPACYRLTLDFMENGVARSGGGAAPCLEFERVDDDSPLSWLELACLSNTPNVRVCFTSPYEIFPECIVTGTGTIRENWLNEMHCRLEVIPDDAAARKGGAVKQVTVISSERGRAVKLSMETGTLTLSVSNPDMGRATLAIPVTYDADPMEIGFNSRYLVDIIDHIESESLMLQLADAGSPVLIYGAGDADDGVRYVLMPMRV